MNSFSGNLEQFHFSAFLYSGGANSISMTREYYQEYACDFDLLYYPFDTQVRKKITISQFYKIVLYFNLQFRQGMGNFTLLQHTKNVQHFKNVQQYYLFVT